MKGNAIQTGLVYAVVRGSMYEGAEISAEPARVVETGVRVENFNHGRSRAQRWSSSNRPSSVSNDGIRVEILDRQTMEPKRTEDGFQTMVLKSRQVIALWDEHAESMRLRAERKQQTAQRSKDTAETLELWTQRLGLQSYQVPSLGGSIRGGEGWDSEYTRNRAALIKMLELAYALGQSDPKEV